MKYKAGDMVKILHSDYDNCGLDVGTTHKIVYAECSGVGLQPVYGGSPLYFRVDEIEPVSSEVETLPINIPTDQVKEFADHLERAADALDRIKEALQ